MLEQHQPPAAPQHPADLRHQRHMRVTVDVVEDAGGERHVEARPVERQGLAVKMPRAYAHYAAALGHLEAAARHVGNGYLRLGEESAQMRRRSANAAAEIENVVRLRPLGAEPDLTHVLHLVGGKEIHILARHADALLMQPRIVSGETVEFLFVHGPRASASRPRRRSSALRGPDFVEDAERAEPAPVVNPPRRPNAAARPRRPEPMPYFASARAGT